MRWIDGSDIDIKLFSGESLCEKLGNEMYYIASEEWFKCAGFIQNAILIMDFDTVINMEGFPTPHYGYYTAEHYARIIMAFQAIGDNQDADILKEAGKIDAHYDRLLSVAKETDKWDDVYDEFSDKLDRLENELYLNREYDIWALLYAYLDEQIRLILEDNNELTELGESCP